MAEVFSVVTGLLVVFIAGGLTALGLIGLALGRVLVNPRRIPWTRTEATVIGLAIAGQGVMGGAFGLYGALALGLHALPSVSALPGVWGLLVGEALIFEGVVPILVVAAVEQHHFHRWPFNSARRTAN